MKEMEVGRIRQAMIYRTLRLVGGFAWESNRRKRQAKEIRCIPDGDFPLRPHETWEDWRKRYTGGA
jgi:hypothetical protein